MKITKRSSERKLLISIGAVLVVAGSAVATYFTLRHFNPPHATTQQPISKEQPAPAPKEKAPDSQKPPALAVPTIALPNATPIPDWKPLCSTRSAKSAFSDVVVVIAFQSVITVAANHL